MSKCLVTKLKAVVDNDNLPVFGQLNPSLNTEESVADVGITPSIKVNSISDQSEYPHQ